VKALLTAHPASVLHFTPTSSSWLNLVERWFAELPQETAPRTQPRRQLNTESAPDPTWNDTRAPTSDKTGRPNPASIGNYATN